MNIEQSQPLKIGIVGAGFSGTALVANLHRLSQTPVEISLFEKTGNFGAGYAYSTPYHFHLLNVRAHDMSAFENEPLHFVNWVKEHPEISSSLDPIEPISDQFLPRLYFRYYLKHLLKTVHADSSPHVKLKLESAEVIDVVPKKNQLELIQADGKVMIFDKVVLALGNHQPSVFPFPVEKIKCIINPWDYKAPLQIAKDDPVFIIGTGLSMIDIVLTLHDQKHQGKIYALSRHGLLPLPHADNKPPILLMKEDLSQNLNQLIKQIRITTKDYIKSGGDWRSVINALRQYVPTMWSHAHLADKKRFLRHVLPYWNIHRHRVHHKIADLLAEKFAKKQFNLLSGRVIEVKNELATIKIRNTHEITQIETKWLINCMGPSLNTTSISQPLIASLIKRGIACVDSLNLGLMTSSTGALQAASGNISSTFYTLGPLRKGMIWESGAVPEIRKQSLDLAKHLLNMT